MSCKDKERPPNAADAFKGLTASLERNNSRCREYEVRKLARNISSRTRDYTHDRTFSNYVLAVSEQKEPAKIAECTRKEQDVAGALFVTLIMDENLPFALCDNREQWKRRLLSLLLKYLRPAFEMPLGQKIWENGWMTTMKIL